MSRASRLGQYIFFTSRYCIENIRLRKTQFMTDLEPKWLIIGTRFDELEGWNSKE